MARRGETARPGDPAPAEEVAAEEVTRDSAVRLCCPFSSSSRPRGSPGSSGSMSRPASSKRSSSAKSAPTT